MTPGFRIIGARRREVKRGRLLGRQLGIVELYFPATRTTVRGVRIIDSGEGPTAVLQLVRGLDGLPLVQIDGGLLDRIGREAALLLPDAPEYDHEDEPEAA